MLTTVFIRVEIVEKESGNCFTFLLAVIIPSFLFFFFFHSPYRGIYIFLLFFYFLSSKFCLNTKQPLMTFI